MEICSTKSKRPFIEIAHLHGLLLDSGLAIVSLDQEPIVERTVRQSTFYDKTPVLLKIHLRFVHIPEQGGAEIFYAEGFLFFHLPGAVF